MRWSSAPTSLSRHEEARTFSRVRLAGRRSGRRIASLTPRCRPSGDTPPRPSDVEDVRRRSRGKRPGADAPEPRVVEVNYNPGPDAQDRLRRLFDMLLEYAARDGSVAPEQRSPSDEGGEDEI